MTLYPLSPSPSARICAPSRALRSLLAKMPRTSLTQEAATIAHIRARPRSLSGQSGTGTLGLITTSGWVIKKTTGIRLKVGPSSSTAILALCKAMTKMGEYRFTELPGSDFT